MDKTTAAIMLDAYIRMYVPDVYQKNIYAIDYEKLKKRGIKLITFDVDDTILPKHTDSLPGAAIIHITGIKKMGFDVVLVSNARDSRVKGFAERLDVEYVARAKKPSVRHFREIRDRYHLAEEQMAHVGNSIVNDVGGANSFGITSCLVRPVAHEKEIAPELERRGLWHKHHREWKGDQYYQLGATQKK